VNYPDIVFPKRIAIVGPECTGKTQLSLALAQHYKTVWVPEYARQYIDRLDRPYEYHDLLKIAWWQLFTEDELALEANKILICDTNLMIIKVWSEFKYQKCDPKIISLLKEKKYDLHLLTNIDVPWENDPQREHPDKREFFFNLYKTELNEMNVEYIEISGQQQQRLTTAIQAIDALLGQSSLS
jgi:NadR type nicotinamide-nucleotide adenylyltransferase